MLDFNNLVTGYAPAGVGLLVVLAYFSFVSLILRIPRT
jgi:hypothetical protein